MALEPGSSELCEVCFWEVEAGSNSVTLEEARENYRAFGASEERFIDNVRPPRPEERNPPTPPQDIFVE
jgi:hypothetical protein